MALVGWWKLDGNALDSSGNGNHGTPSNVTWVNGKIGQCGEFNLNRYVRTDTNIDLKGNISFAAWVKPTGEPPESSFGGIISNHNHDVPSNFTMTYRSTGAVWVHAGFTDGTRSAGITTDSGVVSLNVWSHVIFTYDYSNNRGKIYHNGNIVCNSIFPKTPAFSSYRIIVGQWANSYLNHYEFNGLIDDVRIYDHALSDKEVKELAKAKVLHYKFDDFQEPTENLAIGTITAHTPYNVITSRTGQNLVVTMNSDGYAQYLTLHNGVDYNGKTISISGTMKKNGVPHALPSNRANTYHTVAASKWFFDSVTGDFEIVEICDASSIWFFHTPAGTVGGDVITIDNLQIEEKPYVTPFTSGARAGTVLDASGYNHHAELALATTPKWTEDTKIGMGAYQFDGSKNITHPNPLGQANLEQEWTCSAWVKMDDDTAQQRLNNFNSGNFVKYGVSNSLLYLNSGTNDYYTYGTNIASSVWGHVAFVFRNSDGLRKIYLNGINISTSGPNNTSTPSGIPSSVVVGGNFRGLMDDYRIYATALSDADVLELYQTRASLDDKGSLWTQSIEENGNWDNVISSHNLVINGTQNMQNNYNFSNFVFENNYLRDSNAWVGRFSDLYIPVNQNHIYNGEGEFINGTPSIEHRLYYGVACYDDQKRFIEHWQVNHYTDTRTTLAQELKNGDTVVYVNSVANWRCPTQGATGVWNQVISAWPTTNQYPVFTYTRIGGNYFTNTDAIGSTITLQTAWGGGTIPIGTNVANAYHGNGYNYVFASNPLAPSVWTKYSGTITGWGINNNDMFRYGTYFVRLLFLLNRPTTTGVPATYLRNLRFWNTTTSQKMISPLDKIGPDESGIFIANQFSEIGPTEGLIAYYPLDNNVGDYSGNQNDGIVGGVPGIISGVKEGARLFSASSDRITVPDISGSVLTLCAWHKWDTVSTTWRTVFGNSGNFHHMIFNNNRSINIWDGSQRNFGYSSPDNEWHHYTIILRSAQSADLYVDGAYISTVVTTLDLAARPVQVIGNWGSGSYPCGGLDEVRIYNRALSPEEIGILYDITRPNGPAAKITNDTLYLRGEIKEV